MYEKTGTDNRAGLIKASMKRCSRVHRLFRDCYPEFDGAGAIEAACTAY